MIGSTSNGSAPLRFFCQHVMPAVFDDSLSYYEVICKVVAVLNERDDLLREVIEEVNKNRDDIDQIKQWIEDFDGGNLNPTLENLVKEWIDEHLFFIFEHCVKQVFFGLTVDGYFCAYIPKSWADIIFDTGWDYTKDTYGRLILRWNTDSVHPVNQTYETREEKPHGNAVRINDHVPID